MSSQSEFEKLGRNLRARNGYYSFNHEIHQVTLYYSYETPIALVEPQSKTFLVTQSYHSKTTDRHIERIRLAHIDLEEGGTFDTEMEEIHHRMNLWDAQQAGVE